MRLRVPGIELHTAKASRYGGGCGGYAREAADYRSARALCWTLCQKGNANDKNDDGVPKPMPMCVPLRMCGGWGLGTDGDREGTARGEKFQID